MPALTKSSSITNITNIATDKKNPRAEVGTGIRFMGAYKNRIARVRAKRICNKREDVIYYIMTDFGVFRVQYAENRTRVMREAHERVRRTKPASRVIVTGNRMRVMSVSHINP